IIDVFSRKPQDRQVFLTFDKINNLIGQEIPKDTIKAILSSLEIRINNVTESGMGLTIPTYRVDVTREVDVIEEILRVYGYNNIEFKEKLNASIARTSRYENHRIQDVIGNTLAAMGFHEIMTNSLVPGDAAPQQEGEPVRMLNPLSLDLSMLRTGMLPSGLQTVAHNNNRQKTDLKLFEFGKSYHLLQGTYEEKRHLSLFITGQRNSDSWTVSPSRTDFYYLKGIVESIFLRLGIGELQSGPLDHPEFSEGLQYTQKDTLLASFGIVHKGMLKKFDLKQEVLYADFNWDAILASVDQRNIVYREIPRFPEVTRDFALMLDLATPFQKVYDIAWETEKKLLKKVYLFDVYTGDSIPEGKKSYAVSFTLADSNKTLTDQQVDKIMGKFLDRFQKELGAQLR